MDYRCDSKDIFWAFVFGSRIVCLFVPWVQSVCSHTPTVHSSTISRFLCNFFPRMVPRSFLSTRFTKKSCQVPVPVPCLQRIFFIQKLKFFTLGCIWFEVYYSFYQFIGGENDSDSNTVWSQWHNLYQTVIQKVSNNKPFVKSNLLRYKLHNTISIPKQFIRNNVQQEECLT